MAERSHRFQAPKGTRDFYPEELAVRRAIEHIWREVSLRHGFDEIDGPTFEHLELYTVKSGEGIVSELFSFERAGGDTRYALRPEFTPTLARMVAARAAQLPRPTKWFCLPNFFRAERPQRGRLREFYQWNVDVIGDDSALADAEVIAVAAESMRSFGLQSSEVTIKLSHREVIVEALRGAGVEEASITPALALLDKRGRMPGEAFAQACAELRLDPDRLDARLRDIAVSVNSYHAAREQGRDAPPDGLDTPALEELRQVIDALAALDVLRWCETDFSIVRGLAYYTGTVFEVHESSGRERAIAGGGRYDRLVELFNGPPTPAVGFAMGDVVIRLVLEDLGRLEPLVERTRTRPDVFVINGRDEEPGVNMLPLIAQLRREGLHVRHSTRATRNVGKLLGEANRSGARVALILGEEWEAGQVTLKDLVRGEQEMVSRDEVLRAVRERV